MIVSINQPAYLPWLGYFHRIAMSDVHIVLDHVQFEKNSYTNRNKIRTKDGWCWLSVPVQTKKQFGSLEINKLKIVNDQNWQKKHLATIQQNYAKASYYSNYISFFEKTFSQSWYYLNDLTKRITHRILDELGIKTKILYSSAIHAEGKKSELVLNLCKAVGASEYISGPLGRQYLDQDSFHRRGILIRYHDYLHPVYEQVYPNFEPYMAVIDLLFNHGPESKFILEQQTAEEYEYSCIGSTS